MRLMIPISEAVEEAITDMARMQRAAEAKVAAKMRAEQTNEPAVQPIASHTHGRQGWTAENWIANSGRVSGQLAHDGRFYKNFDVRLRPGNHFQVGVGSSGTKMSFHLPPAK